MNIGSREIVLWLSEPQHQALTRALGEMGTDIETIMQARLEELYSRTVPMTERLRISGRWRQSVWNSSGSGRQAGLSQCSGLWSMDRTAS